MFYLFSCMFMVILCISRLLCMFLYISTIFSILNAQITHVYKRWEFYLGGENLTNYRQQNPIIDAENPFSSSFNATRIWAPVYGVNVYAGLRFSIKQKSEDGKE